MALATFSDLESFGNLKEIYASDRQYQEHIQSTLYGNIKKADASEYQMDGLNLNIPVALQLNESFAALADGERLPEADISKNVFAQYRVKLMYAVIEATQFAATRGHKGGRVDGKYIDELIKGTLMTFLSNVNFDCYGSGVGDRAEVATAVGGASSFTVVTSAKLRPGMKLDWYDSTLTTKRGSIKIGIKSVDRMNKTAYVDSTFGVQRKSRWRA